MAELLSVGLDVGTSTTQLIVSRLTAENRASSFAVPQMEITNREVIYKSPVHFTPLLDESHVDGDAIRLLVAEEYRKAGITPEQVDTGAIIITGETSRKENAKAVLHALSRFAGEFVVATAGPDLESVLAAKGAGAVAYSRDTGKTVLHMDIGGGTSNLALIEDGRITQTGCLNVGGRLIKLDKAGKVYYRSPVLEGISDVILGAIPTREQIAHITQRLVTGLEMAAGLQPAGPVLEKLITQEVPHPWHPPVEPVVLSFSGGVADCIGREISSGSFGDIGPELGAAIRQSKLCQGEFILGQETIRATVIGAGCHSAMLSGSTVFCRNVTLPVQNLPVVTFTKQEQESAALSSLIAHRTAGQESAVVLALPGFSSPNYETVSALAQQLAKHVTTHGIYVCLESDMAKALGQRLSLLLPEGTPCLCIDRVQLTQDSYLDIGTPVGPALPVVVKTLILSQ